MTRPDYEALDNQGLPYTRPSRVVGELPTPAQRIAALAEATPAIAQRIGIPACGVVKFGDPVFRAFVGLDRNKAKRHPDAALLLTMGDDVPLDYCASYKLAIT